MLGGSSIRGATELKAKVDKKIATAPTVNRSIVYNACFIGKNLLINETPVFSGSLILNYFFWIVQFKKVCRGYISNAKDYYYYANYGRKASEIKKAKRLRWWKIPPQEDWNIHKIFALRSGPVEPLRYVENCLIALSNSISGIVSKKLGKWLR